MKKLKLILVFTMLIVISGCGKETSSTPKYKGATIDGCTESCKVELGESFEIILNFSNPGKNDIVSVTMDDIEYTPIGEGSTKWNSTSISLREKEIGVQKYKVNKFKFADKDGVIKEVFVNKYTPSIEVIKIEEKAPSISNVEIENCNSNTCSFYSDEQLNINIYLNNPYQFKIEELQINNGKIPSFTVNEERNKITINSSVTSFNSDLTITSLSYRYNNVVLENIELNYQLPEIAVTPKIFKTIMTEKATKVTTKVNTSLYDYKVYKLYEMIYKSKKVYAIIVHPSTSIQEFITLIDAETEKIIAMDIVQYYSNSVLEQYEEIYIPYFIDKYVYEELNSASILNSSKEELKSASSNVDIAFASVAQYLLEHNLITYNDEGFKGTYKVETTTSNTYTYVSTKEELSQILQSDNLIILSSDSYLTSNVSDAAINNYITKYKHQVYKVDDYVLYSQFLYNDLSYDLHYSFFILMYKGEVIAYLDEKYGNLFKKIGTENFLYRMVAQKIISAS